MPRGWSIGVRSPDRASRLPHSPALELVASCVFVWSGTFFHSPAHVTCTCTSPPTQHTIALCDQLHPHRYRQHVRSTLWSLGALSTTRRTRCLLNGSGHLPGGRHPRVLPPTTCQDRSTTLLRRPVAMVGVTRRSQLDRCHWQHHDYPHLESRHVLLQ